MITFGRFFNDSKVVNIISSTLLTQRIFLIVRYAMHTCKVNNSSLNRKLSLSNGLVTALEHTTIV